MVTLGQYPAHRAMTLGLSLDGDNHAPSPPYLRALDGDVLHLSTFSKRLIPAMKVGFIVCPSSLRPSLYSLKRVMDLGNSAVLQHALAEFMDRGYLRAHINRIVPEYRVRRDALETALRKALPKEVRWHTPSHGVVLWLRLPAPLDPSSVYEEAFRHGVLVSPSPLFAVEGDPERGLRLAFCAEPADRLVEGAKRLGKAIKTIMARTSRHTAKAARVEAPVIGIVGQRIAALETIDRRSSDGRGRPSSRAGARKLDGATTRVRL